MRNARAWNRIALRAALAFGGALSPAVGGVSQAAAASLVQPEGAAAWPETIRARRAAAFFDAVNSASALSAKAFEDAHRAPAQQSQLSIQERVRRIDATREQTGGLTLASVLVDSDRSLVVLATTGRGGTVTCEFLFDGAAEDRIIGVAMTPSTEVVGRPAPDVLDLLINEACATLEARYVFPEVARAMADRLRERRRAGAYDGLVTDRALALQVTEDLRAVSLDKHLTVSVAPPEAGPAAGGVRAADGNYGFRRVEILEGNIGYLRLDAFASGLDAERKASAAMNFLSDCRALIVDLRHNGGGSPDQVRFITSYLFDQPTHLNSMVDRQGNTIEEFWTLAEVPGKRLAAGTPVYVVTSAMTFSGAEEFAYNLKSLKRATIIGETTRGGAHPIQRQPVGDRFSIAVPYMRAHNPITGRNWEGVGVAPDITAPSDEALDRAIAEARAKPAG